jgi:hypothetical protein
MSDGVSGIGNMPFNVQSDIHQQTRARQRIESHFEKQTIEKEHRRVHSAENAAQIRTETNNYRYDRFLRQQEKIQEGIHVNFEVK